MASTLEGIDVLHEAEEAVSIDNPEPREHMAGRDRVLAMLSGVAGRFYEEDEPGWNSVMELLNLPLCYQPGVAMALKGGRWKRAENPKAYVATVAFRLAIEHDLVDRPQFRTAYKKDGIDGGPFSDHISNRKNEDGTEMTYEEQMDRLDLEFGDQFEDLRIEDRVPDWLRMRNGHGWHVDWVRVAQCAVRKGSMLDDVAIILQMMALGVPRDQVFEMAEDEKERKAMQAAWRWVDRNWDSRIVHLFRRECPPEAEPRIMPKPKKLQAGPVPAWEAIRQACERSRPKRECGASQSGFED
jgi:hypothetical protein